MTSTHQWFMRPLLKDDTRRPAWTFVDIETDGLGGEYIIGAYAHEGSDAVHFLTSADEWLDTIMDRRNRGRVWYAHNGGEYDYKYLIRPILDRATERGLTAQPIVQGTDHVIGFILRDGRTTYELRDSYALLPASLQAITATFAPAYSKRGDLYSYRQRFDPANADHLEYLRFDVLGLKHSLLTFDRFCLSTFGIHAAWTAASTALKAFRRKLDRTVPRLRPAVDELVRHAYYGGMCYPRTRALLHDIIALDINAAYAHAMRQGIPHGTGTATDEYHPTRPGFYRVTVHAPADAPMAVIPQRQHSGTIQWRLGTFDTYTTSKEMQHAAELGYTFDVHAGYLFDGMYYPLNTFVDYCESLEVPSRGTALAETIKAMRNGLPGKFGARRERKQWLLADEPPDGYNYTVNEAATGLDDMFVDGLYWQDETAERSYMLPHWAAWITATARLYLVDLCRRVGYENVYYADTDSLFISRQTYDRALLRRSLPIGPAYGQLKVQAEYDSFKVQGPKCYTFKLRGSADRGVKAAGIPRAQATAEGVDQHATVEYTAVRSTLSYLQAPGAMARTASRTYPTGSAAWTYSGDDITPHYAE